MTIQNVSLPQNGLESTDTTANSAAQGTVPQVEKTADPVTSSITSIEKAATQVSEVLTAVAATMPRRSNRPSLKQQLQAALEAVKTSQNIERIQERPISFYWRHKHVCGRIFSQAKVKDFLNQNAEQLIALKGAGRVRLLGLADALQYAASAGNGCAQDAPAVDAGVKAAGCTWAEKLPATAKAEVQYLFVEGARCQSFTPVIRMLKQIPRVLGFEPLVLLWLQGRMFHRRLAEQIGVTESRVSQILSEKTERLMSLVKSEMPEMLQQWELLLQQPAVHESTFARPWFDIGVTPEHAERLASFFVSACGASHPVLHSGVIKDCWCRDPEALRNFAKQLEGHFPMTDAELKSYLEGHAAQISVGALEKAFDRCVTHVREPGLWFNDRKLALEFVLRRVGRPMTRHEIAKALGVKITQTKALLLEHDGLERLGPNLKRTYALK